MYPFVVPNMFGGNYIGHLEEKSPMPKKNPVHPGEIVRQEYLIELDFPTTETAKRIGVTTRGLSPPRTGTGDLRPRGTSTP